MFNYNPQNEDKSGQIIMQGQQNANAIMQQGYDAAGKSLSQAGSSIGAEIDLLNAHNYQSGITQQQAGGAIAALQPYLSVTNPTTRQPYMDQATLDSFNQMNQTNPYGALQAANAYHTIMPQIMRDNYYQGRNQNSAMRANGQTTAF